MTFSHLNAARQAQGVKKRRAWRRVAIAVASVVGCESAHAATRTWNGGGTDNNWSTTLNWGTSGLPVAGDAVAFGGTTRLAANNDLTAATSYSSVAFNAGAGQFVLTGNSITLGGNITNNSSSLQTIDLNLILSAGRTITTDNAQTVTNGGDVLVNGIISESATGSTLNKSGYGTLTLTNNNTYTGTTQVSAGTLNLDFADLGSTGSNIILSGKALTVQGGVFNLTGSAGATDSQTLGTLTLAAATTSAIDLTQNNATSLSLGFGPIARNAGSALDFTLPTSGSITTSSTTFATNGILVSAATNGIAFATVGGTDWATNTAGTIGGLASYNTDSYTATDNTDVMQSTVATAGSGFTVNTLRFNTAATTLNLNTGGASTVGTGGILVTANGIGATIAGGPGASLAPGVARNWSSSTTARSTSRRPLATREP